MLNKNTALARGVRTFVALLAGVVPTWVTINLVTDFQLGTTKIGLGVFAALLGGALSALAALRWAAATPAGKALATFIQGIVSGLGTFTLASLTFVEFQRFGMVVVTVVGASFTAALISLIQNMAEDAGTQTLGK